jgi:Kef-type K+ transport system membrane component KefB
MEISYGGLFLVALVVTLVPLALSFLPRLPLPAPVAEILVGIAIGPAVLAWVSPDDAVLTVFAKFGLTYLLFVAGLELDLRVLIHPRLKLLAIAFGMSLALALTIDLVLGVVGIVETPLFMAIVLSATALGVLTPILKDQGLLQREFGQVVFAACAIAEVVPIVLLSIFYASDASTPAEQLGKVALIVGVAVAIGLVIALGVRRPRLVERFERLADTTAQIRVRETMLVLVALVALADGVGVEVILGAFAAGVVVANTRARKALSDGYFPKIEAIGFGIFIPVFFVYTGLTFDVASLTESIWSVLEIPLFLLLMLLIRGLPALLVYRRLLTGPEAAAAGFFQATNLSFIVAATAVGLELDRISGADAAALLAAGMLSVILYPQIGLWLTRRYGTPDPRPADAPEAGTTPSPGRP